jgi:hypothetical protein
MARIHANETVGNDLRLRLEAAEAQIAELHLRLALKRVA